MTSAQQLSPLAQRYLPYEIALYSLFKPPGRDVASIYSTDPNGRKTYLEMIERDDVLEACADELEACGAPVFADITTHDLYTKALRQHLKAGLPPETARGEALSQYPPDADAA